MIPSIQDLTKEEKILLMEVLWEDLSRDASEYKSPSWHDEVLREREELAAAGLNPSIDWEQAKAEILQEIRENPNSR